MSTEYGADQIQILEGLEAVRKRPGMYIGSTSSRGLHHLVYEIVDNSVDEALAGYCDHIQVFINPDNSVTVIDNGRGIPVGINHKAGLPAVEVVFTVLHAGGKFGGGGYKVSGGLHGVGASVVNALSNWLEVEICSEGKIYKQHYEKGKVMYPLEVIGECELNGTYFYEGKADGVDLIETNKGISFKDNITYNLKNNKRNKVFLRQGINYKSLMYPTEISAQHKTVVLNHPHKTSPATEAAIRDSLHIHICHRARNSQQFINFFKIDIKSLYNK